MQHHRNLCLGKNPMTARIFIIAGTLLSAVAGLCLAVLIALSLFAGGSASGTLSTGRTVTAHSDSLYLFSECSSDTATIKTAGKTIVVRPRSLLVDGQAVGSIDVRVQSVDVTVKDGAITVIADGMPVPLMLR